MCRWAKQDSRHLPPQMIFAYSTSASPHPFRAKKRKHTSAPVKTILRWQCPRVGPQPTRALRPQVGDASRRVPDRQDARLDLVRARCAPGRQRFGVFDVLIPRKGHIEEKPNTRYQKGRAKLLRTRTQPSTKHEHETRCHATENLSRCCEILPRYPS